MGEELAVDWPVLSSKESRCMARGATALPDKNQRNGSIFIKSREKQSDK